MIDNRKSSKRGREEGYNDCVRGVNIFKNNCNCDYKSIYAATGHLDYYLGYEEGNEKGKLKREEKI